MAEDKKINVTRFLQKRAQPLGYATLLKKAHGKEVHTVEQWEKLLQAILDKKV